MVKQGEIIKSVIGTVLLCLSLLVFTMPSTAASSMTNMSAMQHQMQMDDAAHFTSDHCAEMQSTTQSVNTASECCEDGNCQCISATSSVTTMLFSLAPLQEIFMPVVGDLTTVLMADQFSPSINHPPII